MKTTIVVNYYKEIGKDVSNETLHTFCANCATVHRNLEYIDKAPLFEPCEGCLTENVPSEWEES